MDQFAEIVLFVLLFLHHKLSFKYYGYIIFISRFFFNIGRKTLNIYNKRIYNCIPGLFLDT